MRKENIDAGLVARLVAGQFPQWAALPIVPVPLDGGDNRTFRLGPHLAVRLPTHARYVPQVDKEHRWLPFLRESLPFAIPEPIALGRPTSAFPRPWSVYGWIDGEPAGTERVADLEAFAVDLADFLVALRNVDGRSGPPAGRHSFFRGGPPAIYDVEVREAIAASSGQIDADSAHAVWDSALSSCWDVAPCWVHGDIAPSNILVREGRLHAVVDFGCCAVGDPACDLAIAWTFLPPDARRIFHDRVAVDDATWARARGWALWKALVVLCDDQRSGRAADGADTARRLGWSGSARDVIHRVIADHMGRTPDTDAVP